MFNFKLLLLGFLVTMFMQCNADKAAKDPKNKSVTSSAKDHKTTTAASIKGRKAVTTASAKDHKTGTGLSVKTATNTKGSVKDAKNVHLQEDVPDVHTDTDDVALDEGPNEVKVIHDYDDDALEERFHYCLKVHGTSMKKYDENLRKCAKDLNEPIKIKQWLKDNCKSIENTGFPTCYERSFNKIFTICYNEFPYNSDMVVESMRRKFAAMCDLPIIQ